MTRRPFASEIWQLPRSVAANRRCARSCSYSLDPHSKIKHVYLEGNNYSAQTSFADTTRLCTKEEGPRFENTVGSCSSRGTWRFCRAEGPDSVLIKRRLTPRAVNRRRRVLLVARFRINLDFRPEARNTFRASRARNKPPRSFTTAETINSPGGLLIIRACMPLPCVRAVYLNIYSGH